MITLLPLIVAATPATRPDADLESAMTAAKSGTDRADHAWAAAREAATKSFWHTPPGLDFASELAVKKRVREQALSAGTTQERLDAGGDYNLSRLAADAALARYVNLDPAVLQSVADSDQAHRVLARLKSQAAAIKATAAKGQAARNAQAAEDAAHPELAAIRRISQRQPALNAGEADRYEIYKFETQKVVDSLGVIKIGNRYDPPEMTAISDRINVVRDSWMSGLTPKQGIYDSADEVNKAVDSLVHAAASQRKAMDLAEEGEHLAKRNSPSAMDVISEGEKWADDYHYFLKDATEHAERARRYLLTREGQSPAEPPRLK